MIRVDQVSKSYEMHGGHRTVLDRINLDVNSGEKVGILGRNGSGKSTMVRLISGAEHPTSGTITRSMSVSWPLAFSGAFQGSLTGLDNLRFVCRVYNASIQKAEPFVRDFSELGRYMHEPVKNYSSGMRARLAFALSMAIEFDCFLIDEVIAVGDRRFQEKCREELFVKRADRAMIIVSHNPQFVREVCNSAAVLVSGKLHKFKTVDDAYSFYLQHDSED
jgi:capsular polysaccharide transport system ATP-binding protein